MAGKQAVRLKGGDQFVFGRGGEEALVLKAVGLPFEIVLGVSAAIAIPTYAGIPGMHIALLPVLACSRAMNAAKRAYRRASAGHISRLAAYEAAIPCWVNE
jgi:siroheme synthase